MGPGPGEGAGGGGRGHATRRRHDVLGWAAGLHQLFSKGATRAHDSVKSVHDDAESHMEHARPFGLQFCVESLNQKTYNAANHQTHGQWTAQSARAQPAPGVIRGGGGGGTSGLPPLCSQLAICKEKRNKHCKHHRSGTYADPALLAFFCFVLASSVTSCFLMFSFPMLLKRLHKQSV